MKYQRIFYAALLVIYSIGTTSAQDWAWNTQAGYTGQVDLGSSGSLGALTTLVSGSANIAGNAAVQPPLVVNVQAGSSVTGGSLTPSDACLVFKQGTGWVVNGTSTLASPGYICPDGSIYAGIAGGRPFYTAAADIDGGYGMVWGSPSVGAANNNYYPTSYTDGGAVFSCRDLGQGWSLPSRYQLSIMYGNQSAINNAALTLQGGSSFSSSVYFSSQDCGPGYLGGCSYALDFGTGSWSMGYNKSSALKARCIRSY